MGTKKSRHNLSLVALGGAILIALFLFSIAPLVSVQAATQATYQYGDADNDYDVDSADLTLLRNIVLDKSPWNPYADASRDGDVDAADFSLVRNIILGKNTAQQGYGAGYNFNTSGAGTDDLAAWKNVASRPADIYANESGWTDFSSGDYDDIEAEDAAAFTVSGQSGNMSAVECRFKVDETGSLRSSITALGVEVVGNSSANSTAMQCWAWNFNTASWNQLGVDIAIGTTEATYESWSEDWGKVFAQYIDSSGYVYVLVIVTTAERDLTIDYILLSLVTDTVASTPTPTPSVSPTMSPTESPTPSATVTESPTPSATVTASPTPSATVTASPTPSPSPTESPTPTVSPTPTETCMIFWNQSSYSVNNQSNFQVRVNITNAEYLTSGQFDVFYNSSILNVVPAPGSSSVNDTYNRSRFIEGGDNGCGWITETVGYSGIGIGNGTDPRYSGCMRILVDLGDWVQADSWGDCLIGGDGCGVVGDGYLTTITFKGVKAGSCEIAFGAGPGGVLEANQILDYYIYDNYEYPCEPDPPDIPTPTPCTYESMLIWGSNASVTVNP